MDDRFSPPIENFIVDPVLRTGPYEYGMKKTLAIRARLKAMAAAIPARQKEAGIPLSEAQSSTLLGDSSSDSDSHS
jgi:cytochrome c oxidase subunit 1